MGEDAWEILQKKNRVTKIVKYRQQFKRKLIAYKGGKCLVCGYCKDVPGAFVFHHRDPKDKLFSIASSFHRKKKDIYLEVDKCDLLCANCHAEIHDELYRTGIER